jgi:hypothetical protein
MLRRLSAVVLALLLLVGAAAAEPFTPHFDAIRAKALEMRDAIPDPAPSKADAKRRAGLQKIVTAIDRVSTALAQDVATAKTVADLVLKSFRDDADLPPLLLALLTNLKDEIDAWTDALESRLAALPASKRKTAAQKTLAKIRATLAAAAAAAGAQDAKKAAKALVDGEAAASIAFRDPAGLFSFWLSPSGTKARVSARSETSVVVCFDASLAFSGDPVPAGLPKTIRVRGHASIARDPQPAACGAAPAGGMDVAVAGDRLAQSLTASNGAVIGGRVGTTGNWSFTWVSSATYPTDRAQRSFSITIADLPNVHVGVVRALNAQYGEASPVQDGVGRFWGRSILVRVSEETPGSVTICFSALLPAAVGVGPQAPPDVTATGSMTLPR